MNSLMQLTSPRLIFPQSIVQSLVLYALEEMESTLFCNMFPCSFPNPSRANPDQTSASAYHGKCSKELFQGGFVGCTKL